MSRRPPAKEPETRTRAAVKSTSRQRRATSSPRRKPVNAAVRKSAASCSDSAARTSAQTSSGEKTSIVVVAREARLLHVGHRVVAEPVHSARPGQDAVEDRQGLRLDRLPTRSSPSRLRCGQRSGPRVAATRMPARRWARIDRAVVDHRRRLAVEVVLDVAQVLGAGVSERDAGPDHPRQRPGARLVEDVAQPRLGRAFVYQPARGRPRRSRPARSSMDLPAVQAAGTSLASGPRLPSIGRRGPRSASYRASRVVPKTRPSVLVLRNRAVEDPETRKRPQCGPCSMPPPGIEPGTFGLRVRCSAS